MSRPSWILFVVPVVIWSTTFYAITLQLGSVTTPTYAVALGLGGAALMLFAWLDTRPLFWAAFAYLMIAWTIVTFLCYLTLLKREDLTRTM